MGQVGKTIELMGARGFGLGQALLKDVRAEDFGRQPVAAAGTVGSEGNGLIKTNHAAFVYGHLAIYPARMMEFMGLDGSKIDAGQRYQDLFSHGKECVHDPDRVTYPPMDEIVSKYKLGHETVLGVVGGVEDAVFARETPHEGMRARFPTVGSAVGFLLCSHTMMHLGQVSAWRRCMGLGSVM